MIENFAMIAKISLCHSEIFYLLCCFLHPPACISDLSWLLFLHPNLDEIDENSNEHGINQRNFDAKLDMMVEVYETCKTTKNNLETKSVVLKDLHMSIGLINMISTQKAIKTYLK